MPDFRLSPSGAVIGVVATTSSEVENVSEVPEAVTLSEALTNLVSPPIVTLYDDFVAGASYLTTAEANGSLKLGALNWTFSRSGATITLSRSTNGAGTLRGLMGLSLNTNTDRGGFFLGSASMDPELVQSVWWRAFLNGDNTFDSSRRVGLGLNNNALLGTDGIYFEHNRNATGVNVQAVASKASNRTIVNTGIVCPFETYQTFELRRIAPLSWQYYVNGVLGATISGSAIPLVALCPAAQAQASSSIGSSFGVDTFQMTYRRRTS